MTQVAKTLPEVLKMSVEDLQALTVDQLQLLHTLASAGTTKAAKGKVDLINGIITSKRKELQKQQKQQPEPIANSAKPAATGKRVVRKTTSAAPAQPPATPPATPPKPVGNPSASTAQPRTPPKPKTSKTEQSVPEQTPTPEKDLIKRVKEAELGTKQETFPQTFSSNTHKFTRFDPKTVEDLGVVVIANPYRVYVLMDEKITNEPTYLLLVYVSSARAIMIDKSRDKESFISSTDIKSMISERMYVEKDGKQVFKYPISFYVAEALASEES